MLNNKKYIVFVKEFFFVLTIILLVGTISPVYSQCGDNTDCAGCPAEESHSKALQTNTQSDGDDEFLDFDESDQSSESDEFEDFEEFSDEEANTVAAPSSFDSSYEKLYWVLGIIFFTMIAGILVRFSATRNMRTILLIASVIVLGFYRGGCPCMISSFQDVALAGLGMGASWIDMLWFLALIPLTYIFGQVWCGWICHLGALQEFLYKKNRFEFLRSERSQKVMKIIRYVLLAALLIQLIITQSNLFIKIDPFKVAFNLTSYYTAGWILLGLLIITSLFIYRPFCKAACPVGLILGLVKKIPGASILAVKENCNGCKLCSSNCEMDAINRKTNYSVLENKDCFLCGDCMDTCKLESMSFARKSSTVSDKVICRRTSKDEQESCRLN